MKYIFGGAGYGKTKACLLEISAYLKKDKQNKIIYIVPEQFSMQAEKSIVMLTEGKATTSAQVLSFKRLAFHVYSKTGEIGKTLLDDMGKIMLIRKIAQDISNELLIFKKSIDKQGFLDNLSSMITELFQYNISPDSFLELIPKVKSESLRIKLNDIYKIFMNYCKQTTCLSTDTALSFLPDKINNSGFLDNTYVWIDGFDGFTPQEYKVIESILINAKQTTISLTVKDNKISYENLKHEDPFYETKSTVNEITKIADECGILIEPPLFLQKYLRSKKELAFLEHSFFSYSKVKYVSDVENISIIKCSNKYSEAFVIAEKIIEFVRSSQNKFNDIAILTGGLLEYEKAIKSTFNTYNIPYFIDQKEDVLCHPLVELIRSAIDIFIFNWNYESVFRFLKTGLTSFNRDEVDILENYVIAYGIKSYKWKLEKWKYGFESGMFSEQQIHELKDKLLNDLKYIYPAKNTVKGFAIMIFEMLNSLYINIKLSQWADEMNACGNIFLALKHNQIWEKVCDLFEKLVETLGEREVNLRQFKEMVDAGFNAIELSVIPPTQDQVVVGDLERTRLAQIKMLFILGANDGILPKAIDENNLIGDDERSEIKTLGVNIAPDSKQKISYEQFLIYSALTKPTEQLILTYSIGNLEGKAKRPSMLIPKLLKLFPKLNQKEENDFKITLPKPSFAKMGEVLRKLVEQNQLENWESTENTRSIEDEQLAMFKWFAENKHYGELLENMKQMLLQGKAEKRLKSVQNLYGKEFHTTASRLEQYAKCPFSYFLQYNLKAKERAAYDVKPIDLGNLFHGVLEQFTKLVEDNNLSWRNINMQQINSFVDICVDNIATTIASEAMLSTAQHKYTIKRVKRIAKKSVWALVEHIKRGEFEPILTEVEFSNNSPLNAVSINLNGKQVVKITGRIDRVDVAFLNGNNYVKIIDYKTGKTKFDVSDIYFGIQLQLLLYLDAFIKNGFKLFGEDKIETKVLPGGIFYFNIDDPIIDFTNSNSMEVIEKSEILEQAVLETFKMSGLVLADKNVIKKMDNTIESKSDVIPVKVLKSGEFGKGTSAATEAEFNKLCDFAVQKVVDIGNNIVEGNIDVLPYKKGTRTACEFCSFSAICKIDVIATTGKNKYNIVGKKKLSELL